MSEMRKETKELDHTKPTAHLNCGGEPGVKEREEKIRGAANYMIGKLPTTNLNSN